MEYLTLRNCGELGIEFRNIDTDGARISRDFLRRLLCNIISRSVKYYEETGDHAFTYRERQLHSVVCPSIADITTAYLMEHPLMRKPAGEKEYPGHVDYWISYRDYSLLMELKHSFYAYRKPDYPRRRIADRFNSALNQVKNIRIDECRELMEQDKGLIKIALQAIVFYEGSKKEISKVDLKNRDFRKSFNRLLQNTDLKNSSNIECFWLLHERLVEPVEYLNYFEIYPAVAFIGNIAETVS